MVAPKRRRLAHFPAGLADLGHLLVAAPHRGKGAGLRFDDVTELLHRAQERLPVRAGRIPGHGAVLERVLFRRPFDLDLSILVRSPATTDLKRSDSGI